MNKRRKRRESLAGRWNYQMTYGDLTKLYAGQCIGGVQPSALWLSRQDFEDCVDKMVAFSISPTSDRERILRQGYFQFMNAKVAPTQNSGLLSYET